jgi:leucyl aminopeptidase
LLVTARSTKKVVLFGLGARGKGNINSFRKAITAALEEGQGAWCVRACRRSLQLDPAPLPLAAMPSPWRQSLASYAGMLDYVINHQKTALGRSQSREALHQAAPGRHDRKRERDVPWPSSAGFQVAASVNLARDLARTNRPAPSLPPSSPLWRRRWPRATNSLSIKVFDHKQLKKMGAHALLAVAQGSDEKPCLIDIVYSPVGSNESDPVALTLIGKSVTFDSGGLDIKAADGMRNMKRDMSGGGVTLAAIQAIAALGLNIKVRCVMAATENMINGRAYKPGDVLQTMKGLTVEVDNTDAEGRLTLADAIEYAKRQGDTTIVDLATLTGAVKMMTGDVGACIFGNNDEFTNQVFSAATSQNERLLPVPMWEEFKDSNRSDMADLKNSGGAPGSTTAAFFLRAFAGEEIKWCHVDIAGVAFRDRDMGPDPRGATGYGVRTLVELATRLAAKK